MKRANKQDSLIKAVEWKIFEVQSALISEDATPDDFEQGLSWLQSRHYIEIVEERATDNRCGYPLCNNRVQIDSRQQFRINYQEKTIYQVQNSANFCCDGCLQKSFVFEKSLEDTSPFSRDVVKSLDIQKPLKSTITDLLCVLGAEETSKSFESNLDATVKPHELPLHDSLPVYSNRLLTVEGKIITTRTPFQDSNGGPVGYNDQSEPDNRSTQASGMEAKNLLSLMTTSGETDTSVLHRGDASGDHRTHAQQIAPRFQPKKSVSGGRPKRVVPRPIIAASSQKEEETDLHALFEEMKAVRVKAARDATGGGGSATKSPENVVVTSSSREVAWTEPVKERENRSTVRAKTVTWSTGARAVGNVAEEAQQPSRSKRDVHQAKSLQRAGQIMSGRVGEVTERVAPRPMSQSAMMLKQEAPRLPASAESASLAADTAVAAQLPEALLPGGEAGDAFNIEGFAADLRHLRVAPLTTVMNLSYDPLAHWNTAYVEGDASDCESETGNDGDDWGTDNGDRDGGGSSLFLSIWQALDDLFSFTLVALSEQQNAESPWRPQQPANNGNVNNAENGGDRLPVASECQQVQQAIVTMMDRGLRSAERLLNVSRLLQSRGQQMTYNETKNNILAGMNKRLLQCPSLKSAGWTLIGILLVDGVVTRKCALTPSLAAEWEGRVESIAAGVLGGGHIAGAQLRQGDMMVLRSFFDSL